MQHKIFVHSLNVTTYHPNDIIIQLEEKLMLPEK